MKTFSIHENLSIKSFYHFVTFTELHQLYELESDTGKDLEIIYLLL